MYSDDFIIIKSFNIKQASIRLGDFEDYTTAESIIKQLSESRNALLDACNSFCTNTDDYVNIINDCDEYFKHKPIKLKLIAFFRNINQY